MLINTHVFHKKKNVVVPNMLTKNARLNGFRIAQFKTGLSSFHWASKGKEFLYVLGSSFLESHSIHTFAEK